MRLQIKTADDQIVRVDSDSFVIKIKPDMATRTRKAESKRLPYQATASTTFKLPNGRFDRRSYMRNLMREKRAAERQRIVAAAVTPDC
jgi:hypothetical protein